RLSMCLCNALERCRYLLVNHLVLASELGTAGRLTFSSRFPAFRTQRGIHRQLSCSLPLFQPLELSFFLPHACPALPEPHGSLLLSFPLYQQIHAGYPEEPYLCSD